MAGHKNAPIGQMHRVHNWEFADAAARTSATYAVTDVGKEAFQSDNKTFWRIVSVNSEGVAIFREVAGQGDGNAQSLKTLDNISILGTGNIVIPKLLPLDRQTIGTDLLQVASFKLAAGTYAEFSAMLGTAALTDTANLELKKQDGTLLKTLSKTGIVDLVSTTGFTISSDTVVCLMLYGNSPTTTSFVFSVGLK
jgi:hypothetical protein